MLRASGGRGQKPRSPERIRPGEKNRTAEANALHFGIYARSARGTDECVRPYVIRLAWRFFLVD